MTTPEPTVPASAASTSPVPDPPVGRPPAAVADGLRHAVTTAALAEVATRLWRAQRHALKASQDQDTGSSGRSGALNRSVLRELAAALSAFEEAGVSVQSHDGAPFDPGLALVAVSFESIAGLPHEQVIETLRPSIYLGGRHIQRGEVVVGVPHPAEEPPDVS